MSNNKPHDNQLIITPDNAGAVQSSVLASYVLNADTALFNAYTALQRGDAEALEVALISAHEAVTQLRAFGEQSIDIINGLSEVAKVQTRQLDQEMAENLSLSKENEQLREDLIDKEEELDSIEEETLWNADVDFIGAAEYAANQLRKVGKEAAAMELEARAHDALLMKQGVESLVEKINAMIFDRDEFEEEGDEPEDDEFEDEFEDEEAEE